MIGSEAALVFQENRSTYGISRIPATLSRMNACVAALLYFEGLDAVADQSATAYSVTQMGLPYFSCSALTFPRKLSTLGHA